MAAQVAATTRRARGGRVWPEMALMTAAAATRLVNLGSAPYFFSDEAFSAETALGLMRTGAMVRYFFNYPMLFLGKPIFHYWLMGGAFKVLGVGVWQGRLVSALLGVGTAALVYLLARRLFGRAAALIALALYAFSRYALYIDRSMKEDGQATFFALLGIYLFLMAWERRRSGLMAAAGLSLGLSIFSKASTFFVPLALLVYLAIVWARTAEHRRCLSAAALLALTSALPMGLWVLYVLHVREHPPYNVPIEQVTRGVTTEWMYGAVPSVLARSGLKGLVSGAIHLFANLLLRDELRLLGLVGLAWLVSVPRPGRGPLSAIVIAALVCYSFAERQDARQLHVAHIVTLVAAAALVARITWRIDHAGGRALVAIAVAAVCLKGFLFETTVYGLNLKPIIEPDTPEVRAMAWIRDNIPPGERLYCSANIGVFSEHEYVPMGVFGGDPRAVDAFDLKYLVLDRYYCHAVLMGYYVDPATEFELEKIHEIPVKHPADRVEIYRILGPRKGAKPVQWYIHRDPSFNFY